MQGVYIIEADMGSGATYGGLKLAYLQLLSLGAQFKSLAQFYGQNAGHYLGEGGDLHFHLTVEGCVDFDHLLFVLVQLGQELVDDEGFG